MGPSFHALPSISNNSPTSSARLATSTRGIEHAGRSGCPEGSAAEAGTPDPADMASATSTPRRAHRAGDGPAGDAA
jgi:hypothetical protein